MSLAEEYERDEAAASSISSRRPPLKILLVDDSLINRRMASKLLKRSSTAFQDIDEAADGQQALDKVLNSLRASKEDGRREQPPVVGGVATEDKKLKDHAEDVPPVYFAILMDSVMPVMDGPTAVQRIREAGYTGLIVGVTGNVQPEDIEHFISCGADTVMGKPLDTDKLVELLKEAKLTAQHIILRSMEQRRNKVR
jgi:CheY-like chemotaxis protein